MSKIAGILDEVSSHSNTIECRALWGECEQSIGISHWLIFR